MAGAAQPGEHVPLEVGVEAGLGVDGGGCGVPGEVGGQRGGAPPGLSRRYRRVSPPRKPAIVPISDDPGFTAVGESAKVGVATVAATLLTLSGPCQLAPITGVTE